MTHQETVRKICRFRVIAGFGVVNRKPLLFISKMWLGRGWNRRKSVLAYCKMSIDCHPGLKVHLVLPQRESKVTAIAKVVRKKWPWLPGFRGCSGLYNPRQLLRTVP